jgi:hypothetical protein
MPKSGEFCTGHQETGLLIRSLAPYKEDQMAQPAWKRPARQSARRVRERQTRSTSAARASRGATRKSSSFARLRRRNTPTGVISLKMERPPASIASKAQREGISLRPANRSPYNRRKPAKKARRPLFKDDLRQVL